MKTVYLAFGSNIGDRAKWIADAVAKLEAPDLQLRKMSGLYETEPVGLRDQAWFLNAAGEFETTLFPLQLLHRTQRVEMDLGRRRTVINGPRTIDIDVILYGSTVIDTDEMKVPHPRFRERRFVLEPLAEVNTELRDPVSGLSVRELLSALSAQSVRKYSPIH